MDIKNNVYLLAENILSNIRRKNLEDLEAKKNEVYKKSREIEDIDIKMSKFGFSIVKAITDKEDVTKVVEDLEMISSELVKNKKNILASLGYDENYLELKYKCIKCKDTGSTSNGDMCVCLKSIISSLMIENINSQFSLNLKSFDDIDLSLYDEFKDSEKKSMKNNYTFCFDYAKNFTTSSSSLIFFGNTGLGKTHMALAICKEAINKGYSVIYDSASSLFLKIEKEHFNNSLNSDWLNYCMGCDLLFIDDIGAEFITNFTKSLLYNIINSRINKNKPTIITTIDDVKEIEKKYGGRLLSKIIGNFDVLKFCGKDLVILNKIKK